MSVVLTAFHDDLMPFRELHEALLRPLKYALGQPLRFPHRQTLAV